MNKIIAAMTVLLLAGCFDAPVSHTAIAGTDRVERGTASCSKGIGYCMTCGLGFDGKINCVPGFKFNCQGTQPVTRKVWEVVIRYESGKSKRTTESEILTRDGACT